MTAAMSGVWRPEALAVAGEKTCANHRHSIGRKQAICVCSLQKCHTELAGARGKMPRQPGVGGSTLRSGAAAERLAFPASTHRRSANLWFETLTRQGAEVPASRRQGGV